MKRKPRASPLRVNIWGNPKGRSRKIIAMQCGKFRAANRGRVLDAAERAAIEERLRSEGRL
jgi:hypothetical protein